MDAEWLPGLGQAIDLAQNNAAQNTPQPATAGDRSRLSTFESGERLLHAPFHGHGTGARDLLDAEALQEANERENFLLITRCFKR